MRNPNEYSIELNLYNKNNPIVFGKLRGVMMYIDFIKNKFDNDNVAAPESLNGENVKNAIDDKEQKIIPFVKTKAFCFWSLSGAAG